MFIYKQSIKRILNKQFLLIYFIVFIPIFISFFYLFEQLNKGLTFVEQFDLSIAGFFVITFLWTLGIPFLLVCVLQGINLVQQEIEDGLMCVLITKPIKRWQLLGEKLLGAVSSMLLLGVMSILISLSLLIIFFSVPASIYTIYLKLIPSLILYTIFIVLISIGLSVMSAFLLKHRLKAMVLMISFVMTIEFIFPLFKGVLIMTGIYSNYHLFIIDMNYHFGLIYYTLMKNYLHFTPISQQFISQFVGIFNQQNNQLMDTDLGFIPNQFQIVSYLDVKLVLIIYIFIVFGLYYIAFALFNKKDIH